MHTLNKDERLIQLVKEVESAGKLDMQYLSTKFDVSVDTIRRDIKELDNQGFLKAIRGGAISHSPIPKAFQERLAFDTAEKKIIANKAVTLLENEQTIILDGGTSTLAFAHHIPHDLTLTVVTNSFPIVNVLESNPNIEILFAGGKVTKTGFDTSGPETRRMFESIRADFCFISVYSIHDRIGVTTKQYEDAENKKAIIKYSKKIVALSTASKINTSEAFFVCDIGDIDYLVTDNIPTDEKMSKYVHSGLKVI